MLNLRFAYGSSKGLRLERSRAALVSLFSGIPRREILGNSEVLGILFRGHMALSLLGGRHRRFSRLRWGLQLRDTLHQGHEQGVFPLNLLPKPVYLFLEAGR
jgi:hypothetical protein